MSTAVDVALGRSLRGQREGRGRSQADLAVEMRRRGWQWSQATVWSVETGDRPLRLSEAADLASVLGFDLGLFVAIAKARRAAA